MWQIVKDNFVYIVLVIVSIAVGIYFIPPQATEFYNKFMETSNAKKVKEEKESFLNNLRVQAQASAMKSQTTIKDGKKIYELEGTQFSGEASFAPLFEIVLFASP